MMLTGEFTLSSLRPRRAHATKRGTIGLSGPYDLFPLRTTLPAPRSFPGQQGIRDLSETLETDRCRRCSCEGEADSTVDRANTSAMAGAWRKSWRVNRG